MRGVRILLASSEVHPYSKTGGLGDSVGALGKALARTGHQVVTVTPLHRGIRENFDGLRRVDWRFNLPLGKRQVDAQLLALDVAPRHTVYFIDQPEFFDRAGLYNDGQHDYADNAERFIFFSKCVVHLARYLPFKPEVVHVHDWPVGLVPLLAKTEHEIAPWPDFPRFCLTIHNLAYQGVFPRPAFDLTNLPVKCFNVETTEFYGQLNCLKAGIATADVVTTVSPRYAREITTEPFGAGLDGLLRRRRADLIGILNGVDYDEWNTINNPFLSASYNAADLAGKAICKRALQKRFQLEVDSKLPLFGNVSRLVAQKGVNLMLGALEQAFAAPIPMQFVMLGSGDQKFEMALRDLAARYVGRIGLQFGYDQGLAHQIEAGSDFFLMPSRFEPCGLNQLYSLRYGAIPIVRRTGGLDDTVIDATDNSAQANGIKFDAAESSALLKAIQKAWLLFQDAKLLKRFRLNGMRADFSWEQVVTALEAAYRNDSRLQ